MRLPARVLEMGLARADGALFMGRPLVDMTRDELLAIAALGWYAEERERIAPTDEQIAALAALEAP